MQGGGYPAVWGVFLWEARVCSFCWDEQARLIHQKQVRTRGSRSDFYLFFGEFIDLFLLLSWGGVTSGGLGVYRRRFSFNPRIPALNAFPR